MFSKQEYGASGRRSANAHVPLANPDLPSSTRTLPLLTPKQVAERLGVSVDWVQAHATRKSPRIDHIRAGKLIRFTEEHVKDFIRRQQVTHGR